jgi:hypothetical protein
MAMGKMNGGLFCQDKVDKCEYFAKYFAIYELLNWINVSLFQVFFSCMM